MRIAILAMMGAALCGAQTTVNGGRDYKGTLKASGAVSAVDFTAAGSTAPATTGTTAARKAACTQGQIYFAVDATPGQNLTFCTTTGNPGVWSAMTGGSGGGGSTGAGVSYCAPSGGSGTAYACSPTPAVSAYAAGVTVALVPDVNATGGATTLNVSGLGAKSVKLSDGTSNPSSADLGAGRVYFATYDGTVFRIGRGVQSKTAVSHQFLTGINADGSVSAGQPSASDVSGLAASATTDTTNASNLASGTLPDARLSSNVPLKNGANVYTGTQDASGAAHTTPAKTGLLASRPASCTIGEEYFATDAQAGQNKYLCTVTGSPGTWVQQAGGSGGGTGCSPTEQAVTSGVTTTITVPFNCTLASVAQAAPVCVDGSGVAYQPGGVTNSTTQMTLTFQPTAAFTGKCTALIAGVGPTGLAGAAGATGATTNGGIYCADATGSTTAYTCPAPSPVPASYATGALIEFKPQTTNSTTTPTLNVAGLGALTLKGADGGSLAAGALVGGTTYLFSYNGTSLTQSGAGGSTVVPWISSAGFDGGGAVLTSSDTTCNYVTAAVNMSTVKLRSECSGGTDCAGSATVAVRTGTVANYTSSGMAGIATSVCTASLASAYASSTTCPASIPAGSVVCFAGSGFATSVRVKVDAVGSYQ